MNNSLGKILSTHHTGEYGSLYVFVGVLLVIVSLILSLTGWLAWSYPMSTLSYLISATCLITGLIVLYRWRKYKGSYIKIYEHGFIFRINRRLFTHIWRDVDYITQRTERADISGVKAPAKTYLHIKMKDGKKYKLSQNIYQRISELAKCIQTSMAEEILPIIKKKIENGESISFGAFKVNKSCISRGFKMIKWSDIKNIEISGNRVLIKKKGSFFTWSRPFKFQVHNLYVFIPFVTGMLK